MPCGDFVIDGSSDKVLVTTGTGISDFIGFLEALTPESKQQITSSMGHEIRSLLLFQETIPNQLASVPELNVMFFTETADAAFADRMAALPKPPLCINGRIALSYVFLLLPLRPAGHVEVVGRRPSRGRRRLRKHPHRRLGMNLSSDLRSLEVSV